LTERFRVDAEIRKEEEKAVKAPDFIRDYLSKHETGTAAEIAQATGLERKAVNQALPRMCESGELVKVRRGVYQLRGDKWWL
jgi:predicted ArsR family transcriptional regulator